MLRYHGLFDNFREDCLAAGFEFIGTTFFLLFGLGGIQAANAPTTMQGQSSSVIEQVLYISTCMGLSLLVSAWLFFRVTGGLFNPDVSLALFLTGALPPVRFVLYCIAQLVGAIAASAIIYGLTPGELAFNNFLQDGTNTAQGVFIEMFITSVLVLAVLMLAAEKHQATPFAPIGIGLTLFACHLFAVNYTGAAMNTARAFGPAVVTGFPFHDHWVYWLGPFLGSLLGTGIYAILKHYRYWTLNPEQATSDYKKSPEGPVSAVRSAFGSNSSGSRRSGPDASAPRPEGDSPLSTEKPSHANSHVGLQPSSNANTDRHTDNIQNV